MIHLNTSYIAYDKSGGGSEIGDEGHEFRRLSQIALSGTKKALDIGLIQKTSGKLAGFFLDTDTICRYFPIEFVEFSMAKAW